MDQSRRPDAVPVARTRVEASDTEAAADLIRRVYGSDKVKYEPTRGLAPRIRLTSLSAGELRADRLANSFQLRAHVEPGAHVKILRGISGTASVRFWGEDHPIDPGGTLLVPAGVPSRIEAGPGDVAVVVLPFGLVASLAERRAGVRPGGFRFTGVRPVSPAADEHWTRTLALVFDALEPPLTLAAHPLVNEQLLETVAVAALVTFANTAMTPRLAPAPGYAGTSALVRAIAHIEEHAAEPLTVEDIARAAGVGPRALQQAFRRFRGTTPLAFLRDVRLARAHADLVFADAAQQDAVATIGRRWGFARPARFALLYRQVYGCTPDQTLRD